MPITSPLPYNGWPNCIRLSNSQMEVIATTDVGPRILSLARPGGENILGAFPADQGRTGGDEFRFYGGHRLQYAPEVPERIYAPDNDPVAVEMQGEAVTLVRPVEQHTGIRRAIQLSQESESLLLTHTLENTGVWPVELAPWALTIMVPGGTAIAPLRSGAAPEGLLPDRAVVLWPYTRMDDPRLRWGSRFVTLRQDPDTAARVKIGLTTSEGWLAYLHGGSLFVKTFATLSDAPYPDLGARVELFADDFILELETLGPLLTLQPGTTVTHRERWYLFDGVSGSASDDESISALLQPTLERTNEMEA